MEPRRGPTPVDAPQVIAVAFDPAELAALPRHICVPGYAIRLHSIDSLRALDWSNGDLPDFVISPLMTHVFDAHDLAGLLAEKGFCGNYIAIADSVAQPHVIRGDVERVAPSLHFEVVALDSPAPLRVIGT